MNELIAPRTSTRKTEVTAEVTSETKVVIEENTDIDGKAEQQVLIEKEVTVIEKKAEHDAETEKKLEVEVVAVDTIQKDTIVENKVEEKLRYKSKKSKKSPPKATWTS